MTYNARFEKMLPMINITDHFIIEESAYSTLGEDWLAFIQYTLKLAFKKEDTKFKTIRDAVKKRSSLLAMNDKAKNLLGMGEDFSVIDIDVDKNNKLKITQLLGYDELIKIYFSKEKKKVHGMAIRAIIDKFFGYQWGKQKLLYPINKIPQSYQRPENWNEMVQESELAHILTVWFKQKVRSKGSSPKALFHRRQALNRVLSSTRWYSPDQITEHELTLLRLAIREGAGDAKGGDESKRRTKEFDILLLNDLRYMLIDKGRDDIRKPRDIAREKRSQYFGEGSSVEERFEWLDIERYPNFIDLKEKAYDYLNRLKANGLAVATINSKATAVNNFFRFLMEKFPFDEITVDAIDEAFTPNSPKNLCSYFEEVRKSRNSAVGEMYKVIHFLIHCELYSAKARKNTPVVRSKTKRQPYRDAMPKEMVMHIIDILKHRPPNATTKWEREKADSSWWKHDVYPVYPMMMLFGYFIPLRGEQIRWLCREESFVFNAQGQIDTFVINTDKNVNRKYLQEIPCVWDDLQIFVPFLKWHKEYYKHLSKVKYHNDDNSRWEDVVPLMITPQVLRPMSKSTHMDYHKKLLCQYQLEKIEEAKEQGRSDYPVVAWRKDGKAFFKDVEELNNASSTEMKKIGVSYDIHSLRVTGATRYIQSGVGIKTVMELTGHTSPDTLIMVYVDLKREEKEKSLRSAVKKIYFGDKETLIESSNALIKGELTKAYETSKESLTATLDDNKLFSLYRKGSASGIQQELHRGTEIAHLKHPSIWRPMIHGLCPSVKCPEGRENKCSLCPYLITGKLFTEGITHQLNNLFATFQRESVQVQEEKTKGYDNHAKSEFLESMLEEILGWQEILTKISEDIASEHSEDRPNGKADIKKFKQKAMSVFGSEMISTELAYLKNAYNAELMGVEKDIFGMKVLTIKAMKIAAEMGDKELFDAIGQDESKTIDMLMQYYQKGVPHKEEVNKFISSIGILPKKVQHNIKSS
jgi:site-specific recombinase XerD